MRLEIRCIAECPELVPLVGRWHFDEWGHHDPGGTALSWTASLAERVHRDRVPTTFVAFTGGEPVGTACLVEHDMDTRLDLTPWLAGVFVVPEQRGGGIGAALVEHAADRARAFGVTELFLYTNGAERLYRSLGWRAIGRELYEGREVTLMARTLAPPSIPTKVLLVGGSSHVGKSTVASELAARLDWDVVSTDQLARHPGRPWRDDGARPSEDVIGYYTSGTADARLESVLAHYRANVWPIAEALVRARLNNPYDRGLVLEGSALLPESVAAAAFERTASGWLVSGPERIRERVLESSAFDRRSTDEKAWIDAFVERAIRFDAYVAESARRLGLRCVDLGVCDPFPELLRIARAR